MELTARFWGSQHVEARGLKRPLLIGSAESLVDPRQAPDASVPGSIRKERFWKTPGDQVPQRFLNSGFEDRHKGDKSPVGQRVLSPLCDGDPRRELEPHIWS